MLKLILTGNLTTWRNEKAVEKNFHVGVQALKSLQSVTIGTPGKQK